MQLQCECNTQCIHVTFHDVYIGETITDLNKQPKPVHLDSVLVTEIYCTYWHLT